MSTSKRMSPTRYANQLATAEATIEELVARWPLCFSVEPARRRPLSKGIRTEIERATAGELSHRKVAAALAFYCGCDAYLQKMVAGAQRVGLDGLPAGPVSETEAEQAARKLCGYAQRRAERAVERQQMAEVEPAKGGRGKKGGISEAARKAGLTRRTAQRRMTETKPAQNTKSGQVSCPATTEPKPQPTAEPKSPALFEAPKESRPQVSRSTIFATKQKRTVMVETVKRRRIVTPPR